jgi:hypothetical protein
MLFAARTVRFSPVKFRNAQGNPAILHGKVEQFGSTAIPGSRGHASMACENIRHQPGFSAKIGNGVQTMNPVHQLPGKGPPLAHQFFAPGIIVPQPGNGSAKVLDLAFHGPA